MMEYDGDIFRSDIHMILGSAYNSRIHITI